MFNRWNPLYGIDGRTACGLFDRSSSSNTTNLTELVETVTTQTDQSGNSGLNFSDVQGGVSLQTTDQGAVAGGLGVASQSLSTLERVNANSLELLAGLASKSIDASRTLARDSAESSAGFLEQAITGFGSLAKQTSEGADDKIARIVGFALAAVAAVIVLPAIFKSGGKGVVA